MVDCPTCDDSFDSERGMRIHHTQSHGFKLRRFESEDEWLLNRNDDEEWSDADVDRFAAQVERRIQLNKEKYDLNEQSKTIDLS